MPELRALQIERSGAVATVWLDRPDARNALGAEFFENLPVAMAQVGADPEVRAVVIAARGSDFTVGLDLKAMAGVLGGPSDPAGAGGGRASHAVRSLRTRASIVELQGAITSVARCPKPVVAAIHGYCIGGGVDLVSACDLRLATSDAVLSVRETKMAMVADLGSLQRLALIVGSGHLAELAYTGMDLAATRAYEIGLVNRLAPDRDSLHDAARSLASEIAANSPLAVQGTKAVIERATERSVAEGLELVATWNAAFLHSDDLGEAVAAFLEKRPPTFGGR